MESLEMISPSAYGSITCVLKRLLQEVGFVLGIAWSCRGTVAITGVLS